MASLGIRRLLGGLGRPWLCGLPVCPVAILLGRSCLPPLSWPGLPSASLCVVSGGGRDLAFLDNYNVSCRIVPAGLHCPLGVAGASVLWVWGLGLCVLGRWAWCVGASRSGLCGASCRNDHGTNQGPGARNDPHRRAATPPSPKGSRPQTGTGAGFGNGTSAATDFGVGLALAQALSVVFRFPNYCESGWALYILAPNYPKSIQNYLQSIPNYPQTIQNYPQTIPPRIVHRGEKRRNAPDQTEQLLTGLDNAGCKPGAAMPYGKHGAGGPGRRTQGHSQPHRPFYDSHGFLRPRTPHRPTENARPKTDEPWGSPPPAWAQSAPPHMHMIMFFESCKNRSAKGQPIKLVRNQIHEVMFQNRLR